MTNEQNKVLSEIYRRLNYFHGGNVNVKILYLAYPSEAKKIARFKLIEPVGQVTPRCLSWYSLTKEGKKLFKRYLTKGKLSDKTNSEIFNGTRIIKFKLS